MRTGLPGSALSLRERAREHRHIVGVRVYAADAGRSAPRAVYPSIFSDRGAHVEHHGLCSSMSTMLSDAVLDERAKAAFALLSECVRAIASSRVRSATRISSCSLASRSSRSARTESVTSRAEAYMSLPRGTERHDNVR